MHNFERLSDSLGHQKIAKYLSWTDRVFDFTPRRKTRAQHPKRDHHLISYRELIARRVSQ